MNAIGYVRVSTEKQADFGVSLEAQTEKVRAMAVVQSAELVEVIVDAGESAKSLKRPGMGRLLALVDAGAVDTVIIAKLDRLTRSVKDLAELLERFTRRGVSLVTCSSIGAGVAAIRGLFDFPVIRVDDAMAEQAVRMANRVGVVATLRSTLDPSVALLSEKAAAASKRIEIVQNLCDGAHDVLVSGDTETHDRLVSAAIARLSEETDVVVLAQASMARVVAGLPAHQKRVPILSSPESAVRQARLMLCASKPAVAS